MSLISDALKKTQQERKKIREEEEQELDSSPGDLGKYRSGSDRNKRVLYYIMLGLILAFITAVLIIISNQGHETVMKALNTSKSMNTNINTATTNANVNTNTNTNTDTKADTVVKTEPQDKIPDLPVRVEQEVKQEVKNEKDVKQVNPAVFIKSVEWKEDKENSLKFQVVLSGPVDFKIVPVEETKGRLAVDLNDTQSERIDKPVNRLNVKKLRGWYNTPSVFRLVFVLDYLKEYKVYAQGNELFVEFSGTDLSSTKPAVKAVEEPKKERKPENKKPGNKKTEGIKEVSKNGSIKNSVKNKEEGGYEEFVREGDRLIGEKDYLGAVEKYKSALQVRKTPELYHKLYSAFTSMNNDVLAKAYIDDGLKNFPDDFYLNKSAAVVNMKAKDFPRALENAKKAVEKNPGDYNLFNYMGMCYYHMKDYAKALYNFQKSLDLNSDAVENYYYIGLIFDNKAQYKKALEYYNAFVKLNREDKNFKHKAWIIQRIKALKEYLNQGDGDGDKDNK